MPDSSYGRLTQPCPILRCGQSFDGRIGTGRQYARVVDSVSLPADVPPELYFSRKETMPEKTRRYSWGSEEEGVGEKVRVQDEEGQGKGRGSALFRHVLGRKSYPDLHREDQCRRQ
ncbi:hypothetical protein MLD38_017323 [Melastoma candidum]|uniref:Uncharacterized protein n=1 Tax=Melastoma candidum TaxID=119954 RepID=A0ACB9QTS6_9MYRT|nr:hypothetical protein MLD38_017323 [Melastoma candidum]